MSLDFNNTQIENVIFNGTELDKIYMNNVLVFEKSKPIYKRRIMAGDNLYTTIYFDFPDDYILSNYGQFVRCGEWNEHEFYESDTYIDCYFNNDNNYVFDTVDGTVISNMSELDIRKVATEDMCIVNSVDDCTAYRHCYIEDKNIRPIQVGDNLKNATIYLSIPDDAYNYTTEEIGFISATSDGNESDTHVLSFSSSHFTNGDELISYLYIDSAYDDPCKYSYDKETYDIAAGVHPYENYSGINKSVIYLQKDTDIIVSNINKSNYLYPLILVDTTTLG